MTEHLPGGLPPLPDTWSAYDSGASRLVDRRILPDPDYVFCCMGTNDYDRVKHPDCRLNMTNITPNYTRWLREVRTACPTTRIFCVTPPLLVHADEIRSAVEAQYSVGDRKVHVIDLMDTPRRDARTEAQRTSAPDQDRKAGASPRWWAVRGQAHRRRHGRRLRRHLP